MKRFNFILLFFTCFFLQAQSFADQNKHWIYEVNSLVGQSYVEFRVVGDSLVNEIPSLQIKKTLIIYLPQGPNLIRTDDMDLGTDIWANQNDFMYRLVDNEFLPLFALNPNINDQWNIQLSEEYPCLSNDIESTDVVNVVNTGVTNTLSGDLNHKEIQSNGDLSIGWKIYENIGPNTSPYPIPAENCTQIDSDSNAPGNLVCYSDGVDMHLNISQHHHQVCVEQRLNTGDLAFKIEKVKIYPNPVDDYLNLSKEMEKVVIRNRLGQIVRQAENTKRIHVSSLPKGLYIVSFQNGERLKMMKR